MKLEQQKKIRPQKLKGFQDYSHHYMKKRLAYERIIQEEARIAGFEAMDTPCLEYAEVLLGVGGETDKQVYRFPDNGGRDVALRFDLTVPFARYVAEHFGEMIFPFKRLQIGTVWRAEKPQKGRYREFKQCDLDIIGIDSLMADVEIILCFHNILDKFGLAFTMSLGHREVLTAIISATLEPQSVEEIHAVLIILDKLQKIGPEQVSHLLKERTGITHHNIALLLEILSRCDENRNSDLNFAKKVLVTDEAKLHLERLEQVYEILSKTLGKQNIKLNLSIARGLGYYTGLVFETTLDLHPEIGSICSGGRYNKLVERFTDRELPGIGGSIGIDRLLTAEGIVPNKGATDGPFVFIAVATADAFPYGFRVLEKLRAASISSEIVLKEQKIGAQFKFAHRKGVTHVITVGSEEMNSQTVSLKDMQTGIERKSLSFNSLNAELF